MILFCDVLDFSRGHQRGAFPVHEGQEYKDVRPSVFFDKVLVDDRMLLMIRVQWYSHITSCVVEVRVSRLPPHGSYHGSATTVTHRLYTLTFNRCHIVVDTLPHIIYHIWHQKTLNVVTKWQLSRFPICLDCS